MILNHLPPVGDSLGALALLDYEYDSRSATDPSKCTRAQEFTTQSGGHKIRTETAFLSVAAPSLKVTVPGAPDSSRAWARSTRCYRPEQECPASFLSRGNAEE